MWISDPVKFGAKRRRMLEGGAGKLHVRVAGTMHRSCIGGELTPPFLPQVIADFDRTLTKCFYAPGTWFGVDVPAT